MKRFMSAGILAGLLAVAWSVSSFEPALALVYSPMSNCCKCTLVIGKGGYFWGCPCGLSMGADECLIQGRDCQNRGICP